MCAVTNHVSRWLNSIRHRVSLLIYPEKFTSGIFLELLRLQIAQNSSLGIILLDINPPPLTSIIYVNETFLSTLGLASDDLSGKTLQFLYGDDAAHPELAVIRAALLRKEACSVTLQRDRTNGRRFFGELLLVPVHDLRKTLVYYIGILVDVTARKEAEFALTRREARYRQMFHNHSAVKLLIDPQTGWIKDANRAAVDFYGYSLEQLKMMRIQDINMLSDAEILKEMKQAALQERSFFEFRHRLASGEIRDVNVYSSPIDMPEGQLLYSIILDVTKKRDAELRYRALFEQSNDAVFILDVDGNHLEVNRRAEDMFGYTPEEIMTRNARDMVMPNQYQDSDRAYERMMAGEVIPPYERTFKRKDGTPLYAEVNVEAARDANGKITHVQSLVRDISERKHMEEQLRENEEKFRAFLDQSADGIVMTDESGIVIEWNPGMERLTRIAAAEVLGRFIWDVQYEALPQANRTPEAYAQFKAMIVNALSSGDAGWFRESRDVVLIRRDGSQSTIHEVMFPIKTSRGFKLGGILRDIQKRRQIEDALRQSEERQRAILQAIPDLIFRLRADGTILDARAPNATYLLVPEADIIGSGIASVFPEAMARFVADMIQRALESHHAATGETDLVVQGENRRLEVRVVPAGENEALIIARDVSELWKTKHDLEDANARLEFSLDTARIAWWEVDVATGKLKSDKRKATMLGYPLDAFADVRYEQLIALVHPDDHEPIRRAFRDLIDKRKPIYAIDYRMRTVNGSWLWLHDRGELVRSTDGRQLVRGFVIDITERKMAQQREFELALEKERASLLTQFIQDAAHEFRTPLAVISASTYIMMRVDDPVQRLTKKTQIDDEVKRIARLVDMLLTIARLETRQPLTMKPMSLSDVIDLLYQSAISTHGQLPALTCETYAHLPLVMGDPNYLTDALRQLLDNAYQFTPLDGTITVVTGHEDNRVWVEIRDTGCGIAEEDMPHLFELFWRHDEAHSTAGFGLGLPIAQRIIERHAGEISASSILGKGTCFRITLPAISNEHGAG